MKKGRAVQRMRRMSYVAIQAATSVFHGRRTSGVASVCLAFDRRLSFSLARNTFTAQPKVV
jgi:hypothetical protein